MRRNPDAIFLFLIVAWVLLLNNGTPRAYFVGDNIQIRLAPLRGEVNIGPRIAEHSARVIELVTRGVFIR